MAVHAAEVHQTYVETPVAAWAFGPGQRLDPLVTTAGAERGDAESTFAALGEAVASRLA